MLRGNRALPIYEQVHMRGRDLGANPRRGVYYFFSTIISASTSYTNVVNIYPSHIILQGMIYLKTRYTPVVFTLFILNY